MFWSKSHRAGEEPAAGEASADWNDTEHFVADMESKVADYDARLEQRKQELALIEADIFELERLVNAATQAIGTARRTDKLHVRAMINERSATKSVEHRPAMTMASETSAEKPTDELPVGPVVDETSAEKPVEHP